MPLVVPDTVPPAALIEIGVEQVPEPEFDDAHGVGLDDPVLVLIRFQSPAASLAPPE